MLNKCGAELTCGREYYKRRHWENAHKGKPSHFYQKMIVKKDHGRAVKILQNQNECKRNVAHSGEKDCVHQVGDQFSSSKDGNKSN